MTIALHLIIVAPHNSPTLFDKWLVVARERRLRVKPNDTEFEALPPAKT
jgi:hypothetical protein